MERPEVYKACYHGDDAGEPVDEHIDESAYGFGIIVQRRVSFFIVNGLKFVEWRHKDLADDFHPFIEYYIAGNDDKPFPYDIGTYRKEQNPQQEIEVQAAFNGRIPAFGIQRTVERLVYDKYDKGIPYSADNTQDDNHKKRFVIGFNKKIRRHEIQIKNRQ